MDIWSRSLFYRVYVVGGILAVIALTVLVAPAATNPAIAGLPVASWAAGLLALQGRRLYLDTRGGGGFTKHAPSSDPFDPPADPYAALSLTGGGEDAARAMFRFTWWHFTALAVGTVMCCAGGLLSVSGLVDPVYVLAPPVVLILIGAILVPWNVKRGMELSDKWLASLGLRITGMPGLGMWMDSDGDVRPTLRGATILEGRRHGRWVRAGFAVRETVVEVECAGPAFRAVTTEGRFVPADGTPPAVAALLARTGLPARWRSAEVVADGKTITVRRPRGITGGMPEWWLDDLWLAERLAAAAADPSTDHAGDSAAGGAAPMLPA